MPITRQTALPILLGIVAGVSLSTLNSVRAYLAVQDDLQHQIVVIPEVVSCVERISVVKKGYFDEAKKLIAVEVKNDSDKGIIAISLSSKGTKHSYTVTLRTSFEVGAEQQVVLAPQKTAVLRIEVANINKDRPLEIGAVMYADGTAEGCKYFLDLLKEIQLEERTRKGLP
jgi:hypothetical protein